MNQTYRRANRKSWFTIDNEIKNNKDKPIVKVKKTSLLDKPNKGRYNSDISPTAEYVLAIRDMMTVGNNA
tara:strand:+ start:554 stop:763 length:210 start_codon:yes stop_codon:yes gene_type:complete